MEPLLTPKDVAKKLQVHPVSVLRMIREGRLKAFSIARVGRRGRRMYRISNTDLESFVEGSRRQVAV